MSNNTVQCYGCFGSYKNTPTSHLEHPYIGAIPECWEVYSKILEKEYSNPEYFKIHRITVDAYAAQHIGDQSDRRARQSVNIHLIALYLYYDKSYSVENILKVLKKITKNKINWPEVSQVENPSWITVNEIVDASTAQEHIELVKEWGKSVWDHYFNQKDFIITNFNKINI